jgi:ubiquinone/menaquinone biosynthesis C-methylase UbiE
MNKNVLQYRERVLSKVSPYFTGDTLLDVGCGDGEDDILAMKYFKKIHGIDIKEQAGWKDKQTENLTFKAENAQKMPFHNLEFDTVIEKDVLHHVDDPSVALYEMLRVAKSRVIIVEANRYNPLFYVNLTLMGNHQHFTQDKFKKIVMAPGLPCKILHFSARVCPINTDGAIKFYDKVQNFTEKFPLYAPIIEYNMAVIEK